MADRPQPQRATTSVEPAGFFVLRTPLLPFDELADWSRGLRAPAVTDPQQLAAALAHDRGLLRERLCALVARPEVREAIFVASPSLEDSLSAWLEDPESERGQKVERTLVRYFARMTFRATPFGLFAGCSLGSAAARTRLRVDGRGSYRRHSRLDGDYLVALTDALGGDRELRRRLTFRPNGSLYRLGGQWRFAEATTLGGKRTYKLVTLESSEALDGTLARCRGGARLDALIDALVDSEITRAEAERFVHELVDGQILVSELLPPVTGDSPLDDVIATLTRAAHAAAEQLRRTRATLAELDATPLGAQRARYEAIAGGLAELPAQVDLPRLFQVDMTKPATATLGPAVLDEIKRAVTTLQGMAPRAPNVMLARFREAFLARYELREVPLCDALDEELGIGFDRSASPAADAPLLAGLAFGGERKESDAPAGPLFRPLLRLLETAWRTGARTTALADEHLAELSQLQGGAPPPLPASFGLMATVAAASADDVDAGKFTVWVRSVSGPGGANLLGRFCHADARLATQVRAYLRQEEAERPEAIFAEIVHLPEGRMGNVLARPQLRRWELPFLGRSGAPEDHQLAVDDLLVSVRDGRVVLRSRRHDREVIPRLTSAHSFGGKRNLGVYRFLGLLQLQQSASLALGWGALEQASFLPRVTVGRAVLSLARWRIAGADLQPLLRASGTEQYQEARALRRRFDLPRWVAVADHDNVLPIDLDNPLAVATLVQLVRPRAEVTLTELFGADERCVEGPEGTFTHELIIPFRTLPSAHASAPPPASPLERVSLVQRFPPGSEWIYAKLYTGTVMADTVLQAVVAPLVERVRGAVDCWFFVRFGDPEWHLRLRFHGDRERLRAEVAPALDGAISAALDEGLIWKAQLDTYVPELERYGGLIGTRLSERLFCADSEAVLAVLAGAPPESVWRLALRGMDRLLDDLRLSLADKQRLLARCRAQYAREFNAAPVLARQIGARFREERLALERLLDGDGSGLDELAPAAQALAARSPAVAAVARELRAACGAGRMHVPVEELASSYLHMHANRMLHAAARAQEVVLYDFLDRLYQGKLARQQRRDR